MLCSALPAAIADLAGIGRRAAAQVSAEISGDEVRHHNLKPSDHLFPLLGIMENDAERLAMSRAQTTDTVPKIDPMGSPLPLYGAVTDGKGYSIALAQRNHLRTRLHAGTLLGKYKPPASKISFRLRQQDGHLYREDMFAVEILVEAVVVPFTIFEEQRGGQTLSRIMTSQKEIGVLLRKAHLDAQHGVPMIADRRQVSV